MVTISIDAVDKQVGESKHYQIEMRHLRVEIERLTSLAYKTKGMFMLYYSVIMFMICLHVCMYVWYSMAGERKW